MCEYAYVVDVHLCEFKLIIDLALYLDTVNKPTLNIDG